MNIFKGYDLDNLERKSVKELAALSRQAGAEGIVLLKNDSVLPFDKSKSISVFGRHQLDYVKSGLGSGGLVNTEYTVNITEGLQGRIKLNEEVLSVYDKWVGENPADMGCGWHNAPWTQPEMPLTDAMCKQASAKSDYALIVIGRIAGEARDNENVPESFLLSAEEEKMIETVSKYFDKVCVALNAGNIIDMKWVEKYSIPCVLYCWQGGQEGGSSLADILLGDITPSGKLTDTIAYDAEDYPSTKNHGDAVKNVYQEDIYVGYRYFETFTPEKVLYPFGFGLSYTEFDYKYDACCAGENIKVTASVTNVGKYAGKAVVQVYFKAPQGRLGKPAKQLVSFAKTKTLAAGETQSLEMHFEFSDMAAYDDTESFAYILEKGEYIIYAGDNVRDSEEIFKIDIDEKITEQCRQALAPTEQFEIMKPVLENGDIKLSYTDAATRKYDINERVKEHITEQQEPQGKLGITLKQVAEGKYALDEFISQVSVEELACLVRGEGMNSPKVTRGTASVFGGVTNELLAYGIPPVCTTDGPSGLRFDTGERATLIANGTCLASTWNTEIVKEIHEYLGIELRANNVDIILAPGINIHRSPLNGRNFEYFSEDPYLAGMMAAACTKGLSNAGVAGTLKHYACNSQEFSRRETNSVVSERALREIYLKPFEIAIKQGNATAIMTSYNKINGSHSATNYDLCTSILRDEWGYKGIVMTDWWTSLDGDGDNRGSNLKDMIIAQNDMYMVCDSAEKYQDNIMESIANGTLDLTHLRKCVKNILSFILTSPALYRKPQVYEAVYRSEYDEIFEIKNIKSNVEYDLKAANAIELSYITAGSELEQFVINVFEDEKYLTCALVKGSGENEAKAFIPLPEHEKNIRIEFSGSFEYVKLKALAKK